LSKAFAAGKVQGAVDAEGSEVCEACVAFSSEHYPNGLNANFFDGSEAEVVESHIKKFENPESRDIAKAVPDIMKVLKEEVGLTKRSVIADMGAGTGLFLNVLSEEAKSVFAVEISPHFQEYLRKQVKVRRLQNVTVVAGTALDPCLPPASVDVVFLCDVYHHIEYPKTVCKRLLESLRPGGRLVVIDFIRDEAVHKSHPPGWILQHVRAGQEVFRAEIESVGFRLVSEPAVPSLAENYFMIFAPPL